ncbi:hypothetical protein GCM10010329_09640 [Streptomyces spiroverticillatus]|uniref:Uncharacterized protein n=1 Tax=Streptomyces finlayi TaxID=67296 RepID=A0A918WXX4_9ACTN|nr:hypothetical protein GCM10010329_09640 [Streptomyces spiroverticillatus]GHC93858.1 hypothetical protein GCM10010334_31440 [Streptomyces finlayi]
MAADRVRRAGGAAVCAAGGTGVRGAVLRGAAEVGVAGGRPRGPVPGVRAGAGTGAGPDRAYRPLARPSRPRGAAPPPKGARAEVGGAALPPAQRIRMEPETTMETV